MSIGLKNVLRVGTSIVHNLFQDPVEQPPFGFRKAEEETRQLEEPDSLRKYECPFFILGPISF